MKKHPDDLYRFIFDQKYSSKTWYLFFIDIVSNSESHKGIAWKMYALNELIQRTNTFKNENVKKLLIFPIVNGMVIGFSDSPKKPVDLAMEIHIALRKYNHNQRNKENIILVRIGIDMGPVIVLNGIKGEIFCGHGVRYAHEIMNLCGPNNIFASVGIEDALKSFPKYKGIMHMIGIYKMYDSSYPIYNIFNKNFGNEQIPTEKIKPSRQVDVFYNYVFESIEVHLEIANPKTMTHHTWVWEIKNMTSVPLTFIHYKISGDYPKEFSQLNVKITDEKNNLLEIIRFNENRSFEKDFTVALDTPILKHQRGKLLKLEYDWEEPERYFRYHFASKVKNFKYFFTAPKDLKIKPKIIELTTLRKREIEPIPDIKYTDERIEIFWETEKNRKIHADAFEFRW